MSRRPATPSGDADESADIPPQAQRIDQWLFFARLVKTRGLAQKLVSSGHVRINREKQTTASHLVRIGDVLTIAVPGGPKVLRVISSASRRGPPGEAQALYEDLGSREQGFSH